MDQKGKHGSTKENSWGDINLQTTAKPGVTDLRPYAKNDLTMSEMHYQPCDLGNVMRKSFSNDIFEAALKRQLNNDSRYIQHNTAHTMNQSQIVYDDSTYGVGSRRRRKKFLNHLRLSSLLISLIRVDSALLRFSIMTDMQDVELAIHRTNKRLRQKEEIHIIDISPSNGLLKCRSVLLISSRNNIHNPLCLGNSLDSLSVTKIVPIAGPKIVEIDKPDESCYTTSAGESVCSNSKLSSISETLNELKNYNDKALQYRGKWQIRKVWPDRRRIDKMTYAIFPKRTRIVSKFSKVTKEKELATARSMSPSPSSCLVQNDQCICKSDLHKLNLHLTSSIDFDHILKSFGLYMNFKASLTTSQEVVNKTSPLDLCKCCGTSVLNSWIHSSKMYLYECLPCAYTLIKLKIINSCYTNDIALLKLIGDKHLQCHAKIIHSASLPLCQRFYIPKFNNRLASSRLYTYTTRHYHHFLTRWRDVLNAITRRNVEERVHGHNRTQTNDMQLTDSWLSGGTFGSRNAVLVFRSSALAQSSEADIQMKPGHKLHITFRVVQAETKLLAKLLDSHGVVEASLDSNDFNILWTGSHPKPGILRSMAPHQRVNHFPRSYELTRKDRLYKNIEKMQHAKGFKHFDFIPQTFLMPTEYRELCSTHHRVKGPWIVKPAASSRGRGIYIVESPNQVPIEEPVVVAKYISKPLLIKGHKCDLRLYVAVTSFDPLLIYIYEEGMVRFATVKYDTTHKQLWNPCMHLCNYSINKYHSDYVKSDDPSAENVGHKWTLSALLRHLKSVGNDTAQLMTQVEDLVIKAILASGNSIITACKMFVPNSYNCFELYGFDILIDENLKPWLLEVNLSPSLGCDSPLDVRLKSAMLADLLTLVGIPAVDPMIKPSSPASTTSTKSLKMKMSNCRQIHSAEGLSNHTLPKKASKGSVSLSNSSLTSEDSKMIKNAKNQFLRRGGYVRIFPAVDSWSKYAQYLDPVTGIPIAGSSTSIPFSFMGQHNNNQILYKSLYPEMTVTPTSVRNEKNSRLLHADRKRDGSLDSVRRYEGPVSTPRQDRYERKLSQGHKSTLSAPKKPLKEDYSDDLKKQVCDMIKNGKKLSQVEARKAFSQYLLCVLKRISSSPDQDGHIEIVLKFLQKASTYLKNPFYVKIPSHKLSEKDRAAIVAKQLNDFLYLYNRETELYADLDRPSQIPKNVFNDFLEHSRESDLEELLILQNIHTVPNKGNDSNSTPPNINSFQGLLRCLPSINSICFSSPETTKKPVKVTPLS